MEKSFALIPFRMAWRATPSMRFIEIARARGGSVTAMSDLPDSKMESSKYLAKTTGSLTGSERFFKIMKEAYGLAPKKAWRNSRMEHSKASTIQLSWRVA